MAKKELGKRAEELTAEIAKLKRGTMSILVMIVAKRSRWSRSSWR